MKRLLIINPDNPFKNEVSAIEPPVWAGLYADYARKQGYDVEIDDLQDDSDIPWGNKIDEVWILVMGNNPSASSTPKMSLAKVINDRWVDNGKIMFGGLHPWALPEVTRHETEAEILPMIKPTDYQVAWDLLPMDIYRAHNWHCLGMKDRSHYASIYTAYGCPFSCDFCNVRCLYGKGVWLPRKVGDVVTELAYLKETYQIRHLKICDELFTVGGKRLKYLCDSIEDFQFNIWAYARVGKVNPVMLNSMKKAGINWLAYGFESFDEGVRGNKVYQDDDKTINMTRAAGINIMGNFIFGLPGDNEERMQRTLDKAMRYNFEFVNFYVYMPYPGSALWKNEYSHDWSRYDQYSDNPMAERKFVDFRDKAFKAYFTNPDYLSMIEKKFGTLGREQIRDMLSSRQPRLAYAR